MGLIKESIAVWPSKGGWKLIHKHIPHSVVSKMFHASEKRLEYSTPGALLIACDEAKYLIDGKYLTPSHVFLQVELKMKTGVETNCCQEMLGVAPPGDLEMQIKVFMDQTKVK